MTTLYEKRGKRYALWGAAWSNEFDLLRAGQFRLSYCPKDGMRVYHYEVTPMSAPVEAALMIVRQGMEDAMDAARVSKPQAPAVPYTPKQRELIDKFRADMAELPII